MTLAVSIKMEIPGLRQSIPHQSQFVGNGTGFVPSGSALLQPDSQDATRVLLSFLQLHADVKRNSGHCSQSVPPWMCVEQGPE